MATYVPNATQTTEPVESRTVESAALEFRTLKSSINSRVAALEAKDGLLDAEDDALQAEIDAVEVRTLALEQLAFNGSTPGTVVTSRFTTDGVQTAFTLSVTPVTVAAVDAYINGIYQNHDTFSVSGTTVTFSQAPTVGVLELQVSVPLQIGVTTADAVSYTPAGTGAVSTTVQDALHNTPSVWDFMSSAQKADALLDTPVLDHSTAFQAAVNNAILTGVKKIFIPFSRGQRYRFESTVTILADDFAITGDHHPIRQTKGYIYSVAGVDGLFDYGGSSSNSFTGAFVCDGVSFYGRVNVETGNYSSQPRAIKFTQTYNGPTRHMLFRNVTANNFYDAFYFDNPAAGTLAGATVTFDACYTRNNSNSAVYANKRLLGLRYVGNLSESGGQIKGAIHGGVTITDNMLEGSVNTIDISGTGPSNLLLARNYFEANSGEFVCRFKPTNIGSSLILDDNFFGGGAGLSNYDDFVYVGGGATLVENNTAATIYFALSTIESAWQGSKLRGKFFQPVDSGKSTTIWCDPNPHIGKKPAAATTIRVIGFDEIETPFGRTKNGLIHTGATLGSIGPSQAATYNAGDVIVTVALVKADEGALPRMIIYDQSSVNLPADAGNMTTGGSAIQPNMGNEWQLWCYAFPAARAGTGLRFRFGAGVSGKSVYIASYGYQVIQAADFVTTSYSAKTRAKVQLWTPFYLDPPELDGSKTHDWPDLASGATQSTTVTVTGATLGDFAEASMSVSMGGTRMWAEVTATDTVTVYQRNDTGGNVNVTSGTLRVRVRKQS